MQLVLDIPDDLASRVQKATVSLSELLEHGLRGIASEQSGLRRDVIAFLARGPRPREIVDFRPSEAHQRRCRELLERNASGTLSPAEVAELDEFESLDRMMSLIKAESLRHATAP